MFNRLNTIMPVTSLCFVDGADGSRAEWLLQRGRALNVQSGPSQEAEEALSKAVKLEPSLAQAWVHLGECYWKNGDVDGAKNCFTGALSHVGC